MPSPFTALFLLLDLAMLLAWRRSGIPRRRLALAGLSLALLQLYCTPIIGRQFAGWLECQFPKIEHRAENIDAIVVLSGSTVPPDTASEQALPGDRALLRCIRAAGLYRRRTP